MDLVIIQVTNVVSRRSGLRIAVDNEAEVIKLTTITELVDSEPIALWIASLLYSKGLPANVGEIDVGSRSAYSV